ncbi:hypothetical protein KAR29_04895 [Aminithiophilus ramosus]|uniref:Uncharacterized protein n=1 Tax=Aminithiophilus ramosus TaxID=3029084 RepID=A0A9Q7EX06_9BACT|nr:hypothetical protein [Aminithiophilus ramosus]QTX33234.1 hypothetical protein KAR29_04895 [Aminithiophilus ramosus]
MSEVPEESPSKHLRFDLFQDEETGIVTMGLFGRKSITFINPGEALLLAELLIHQSQIWLSLYPFRDEESSCACTASSIEKGPRDLLFE